MKGGQCSVPKGVRKLDNICKVNIKLWYIHMLREMFMVFLFEQSLNYGIISKMV